MDPLLQRGRRETMCHRKMLGKMLYFLLVKTCSMNILCANFKLIVSIAEDFVSD